MQIFFRVETNGLSAASTQQPPEKAPAVGATGAAPLHANRMTHLCHTVFSRVRQRGKDMHLMLENKWFQHGMHEQAARVC